MLKPKLKAWCNTLYSDSPATKKKESFSLILERSVRDVCLCSSNPFKDLNRSQGNKNAFKCKELYHQLPLMTYWIQFSNYMWQRTVLYKYKVCSKLQQNNGIVIVQVPMFWQKSYTVFLLNKTNKKRIHSFQKLLLACSRTLIISD